MKNQHLFGTDGIRGLSGSGYITHESIARIAHCIYQVCLSNHITEKSQPPIAIIGNDSRESSKWIFKAITTVLIGYGVHIINVGECPTASISYFVRQKHAKIGIMISASHNPSCDNGIKIFNAKGFKIHIDDQESIESLYFNFDKFQYTNAWNNYDIGSVEHNSELHSQYVNYIMGNFPIKNFPKKHIVIDCANGATSSIMQKVVEASGMNAVIINNEPNGYNINYECGVSSLAQLSDAVKSNSAMMGVAFDGDGDRALFVDENGRAMDPSTVIGIIMQYMLNTGKMNANTSIVLTKVVNSGLFKFIHQHGINIHTSDIGDYSVSHTMRHHNSIIGAENNGHVLLPACNYCSDGIATMFLFITALKHFGCSIGSMRYIFELIPQVAVNIPIHYPRDNLYKVINSEDFIAFSQSYESKLQEGKIIVRVSGTEPCIRIICESSSNASEVESAISNIRDYIMNISYQ